LKRIIEITVYSNLWISFGASCLAWLFYQLMGWGINFNILCFLFFSTLLTYTFQRFIKIFYGDKTSGPRMSWMKENETLSKIILVVSTVGTLYYSYFLSWTSLCILLILGAISFFYAYKIDFKQHSKNLRDLPGIKIFLIGIVWASSTALVPAIEENTINSKIILITLGFFFYIIGVTIPFDIRDIELDEKTKKTLPQLLGEKRSILLAIVLVILSYALINIPDFQEWKLGLGILFTILIIAATRKNRTEFFFSLITDGLLIIMPLSYYLLNIL
jgi:UbiA prenyltransferase family